MLTIIMNPDKSLSKKSSAVIYQGENLVDNVKFLLPQMYGDLSLADFTVCLTYIDPANISRTEKLVLKDANYKGSMLYYCLPVTSTLTKFAGNIKVHLMLFTDQARVMHCGDTTITINPVDPCYHKIIVLPDDSDDNGSTDGGDGGNSSEGGFPVIKF